MRACADASMRPWKSAGMRARRQLHTQRVHWRMMGNRKRPLGTIIGCGNHKGGVSKSTSATYIAAALGERNLKVLIVDCDPSAGATQIYGIEGKSFAGTSELVLRDNPDPVALAVSDG